MKQSSNSNPLLVESNVDKTIGFVLRYSPLRQWRGVFENYLRWSFQTLDSEGKQAQDRLKSYKSFVEDCISRSRILDYRRNKYKKLQPILRILGELIANQDVQGIRWLQTVMRISEIARPSQRFLEKELVDFVSKMDKEYSPESPELTKQPAHVDNIEVILRAERSQYPEFPFQGFQDWIKQSESFLNSRYKASAARPRLHAAFLTKKSAARINIRRDASKPKFASVPSIVLADLEMMRNYLREEDPLNSSRTKLCSTQLARATLKSLDLEKAYSYEYDPSVIKDRGKLEEFLDKDFIGHRITTVAIPASAGIKARIVHKGSYPIQYSLSLLHDTIMNVLREIPQDYSSSHEDGFQAVRSASASEPFMSGFDATGFTDNFPLVLEHIVLRTTAGEQVAKYWSSTMRCPISVYLSNPNGGRQAYRYRMSTGQPMGLWSSWAVCTLSHHVLVHYAYFRAGVPVDHFDDRTGWARFAHDYWMVGDDLVISDPRAAQEYIRLMNTIGVPINLTKSKVLDRSVGHGLIEFVHRQAWYGIEVTGLSPKVVGNCLNNYSSLANFIRHTRERGLSLDESTMFNELVKLTNSQRRGKVSANRVKQLTRLPASLIELGRRIPAQLGGLGSDDQNWNLFDPELLVEAMLHQISSIITMYRPGSPILRDGRNNADEVLQAVQYLPDDALNVDKLAISRYERSVWEDSANALFIRQVTTALESLIRPARDAILESSAALEVIDLEQLKQWYLPFLESVRSTAGVPVYLAREFEKRQSGMIVPKLWRRSKVRDTESPLDWFGYVERKTQSLLDRLDRLSHSFYEKEKTSAKETQQLYEELFANAFTFDHEANET